MKVNFVKLHEVEIQRQNVTPRQFWSYCKREIERRTGGKLHLSDWLDNFGDWETPTCESKWHKNEHESWGQDARTEVIRYEPFGCQWYLQGSYNFIMEFDFYDEKTGFGYLYMCDMEEVPTEPEEPQDVTTEAEPQDVEAGQPAEEPQTVEADSEPLTKCGVSYHISYNSEYGSHEVTFGGKPAAETRAALKALKMRWNPKKMCWYGYAAEHEIIAAIQGAELAAKPDEGATVTTDGYMGGGAIYGSKSNTHLDGAELAKVFRAEIKKAGIKGVTIATRCGMTDHYSVTVTIERGDLTPAPEADPTNHYTCEMLRDAHRSGWLTIGGESYHHEKLESLPAEEQTALALRYHREEREQYAQGRSLNSYYMGGDNHPEFAPAFLAKLAKIKSILDSYRYDESNSMVDYFNTNFYYDFYTKPGKSWAVQADTSDIERAEEEATAAVTA